MPFRALVIVFALLIYPAAGQTLTMDQFIDLELAHGATWDQAFALYKAAQSIADERQRMDIQLEHQQAARLRGAARLEEEAALCLATLKTEFCTDDARALIHSREAKMPATERAAH